DQLKAHDPAIKTLTMDENQQQLAALETFTQQAKPAATAKATTDEKQVAQPQRVARQQRREDRKGKSRERNEEIIKDALTRVQNYQNGPKEVQQYLDFVAQGQNYSPRNTLLIYGQ